MTERPLSDDELKAIAEQEVLNYLERYPDFGDLSENLWGEVNYDDELRVIATHVATIMNGIIEQYTTPGE